MKLLADVHISRAMTAQLVNWGHDVLHAHTLAPRLPDSEILRIAVEQQRVVLTADKDFGELVFRRALPSAGIILLRLTGASESDRLETFQKLWPIIEANVAGHFVVVTDKLVRRTPLPRV
jgi:predicted nuclease of predicted toxin-antitoxin system